MRAGELNTTITFRRKTTAYNTCNEPIETWSDAFTLWASVMIDEGKEFYAMKKIYSETSAIFKVRYTEKIKENMHIKHGNSVYEIIGKPKPAKGKKKELIIVAKEVV